MKRRFTADVELIADGLEFPESPRYVDGSVWCVSGQHVITANSTGIQQVAELPGLLLGLQFVDGRVRVAAARLRAIYEIGLGGEQSLLADLGPLGDRPINEFVATDDGHMYVGQMGYDPRAGEPPLAVPMIRVDPAGHASLSGPPLVFANGIVFGEKRQSLLVAESGAGRITEIPINDDGTLGDASLFAEIDGPPGTPDGICRLDDGTVWCAVGDALVHVDRGRELERIFVGNSFVTSCVAGAEEGGRMEIFFTAVQRGSEYSGVIGRVWVDRIAESQTEGNNMTEGTI